ncbi:ras-related protein [Musa troglodytarum]|uniref:Ras-related protein n=1 Tax=Musa troglodytarum TaxID=320322 RepID=A0A9E7EAD6_9LILI|nr:ras-related protein [Musa troglodytarum]
MRNVSVDEGKSLAEAEGLFFIETSAVDSASVKKASEIVTKGLSRKALNSDSYKAELSLDSASLTSNGSDETKQTSSKFSCCRNYFLVVQQI